MEAFPQLCLHLVFRHLESYPHSLLMASLVHSRWCVLAMPLLWRNALELGAQNPVSFMSTLLGCLSREERRALELRPVRPKETGCRSRTLQEAYNQAIAWLHDRPTGDMEPQYRRCIRRAVMHELERVGQWLGLDSGSGPLTTLPYTRYVRRVSVRDLTQLVNRYCDPTKDAMQPVNRYHYFIKESPPSAQDLYNVLLAHLVGSCDRIAEYVSAEKVHIPRNIQDQSPFLLPGAEGSLSRLQQYVCVEVDAANLARVAEVARNIMELQIGSRIMNVGKREVLNRQTFDAILELLARQRSLQVVHFCHILQSAEHVEATITCLERFHSLRVIEFFDVDFDDFNLLPALARLTGVDTLELIRCRNVGVCDSTELDACAFCNLVRLNIQLSDLPRDVFSLLTARAGSSLLYLFCYAADLLVPDLMTIVADNNDSLLRFTNVSKNPPSLWHMPSLLRSCQCLQSVFYSVHNENWSSDVDKLLPELGALFPPDLTSFSIHARIRFTPAALRAFLDGITVPIAKLSFANSTAIGDEHLEIFRCWAKPSLRKLRLDNARASKAACQRLQILLPFADVTLPKSD